MLNPIEKRKTALTALSTIYGLVIERIAAIERTTDEYLTKAQDLSNDPDTVEYYKEQAEKRAIKCKTYSDILDKLKDMSENIDID